MTKHLPLNIKYQLATHILEGESFSEVAERFNISKSGAARVFHLMKFKIFPLITERERLNIDMNKINNLRESWVKVKGPENQLSSTFVYNTMPKKLTQKELHRLFFYDPLIGDFIYKISRGGNLKGTIAGTLDCGYRNIKIDRKKYKAHRLVWLYVYGYFPENEIDHKFGIKDDNRLSELREVSHQCNMRNKKVYSSNSSGVSGVSFSSKNGKWQAYISVGHIGFFIDKVDAVKARWKAEVKNGYPNCNTTSSAYLYLKAVNLI